MKCMQILILVFILFGCFVFSSYTDSLHWLRHEDKAVAGTISNHFKFSLHIERIHDKDI